MSDGVRFAAPGEIDELACSVCGEIMGVVRNVNGPTGFAEAMAKRKHLHDSFTCPFREEMWHMQVCKLLEAAQKNPSKKIADIMHAEALEVLEAREETKEVSKF